MRRQHFLTNSHKNIKENKRTDSSLWITASMFRAIEKKELNVNKLEDDPDLKAMDVKLLESKKQLELSGLTSRLWLQYMNMIDILKSNIRSDRTGKSSGSNFQLYF